MHIGIVIWQLFYVRGGIERFGINLAEEMKRRGHNVTLFHAEQHLPASSPVYPVSPDISLVGLPRNLNTSGTVNDIRGKIQNSHIDVLAVLFAGGELLLFSAALDGTGIPLLASEHNDPHAIETKIWNSRERRACLCAADYIHTLLPSFISGFPQYLHNRIRVIPNPVQIKIKEKNIIKKENRRKNILSVGRFDERQKQFSLLLKAFSFLTHDFPDWDLILCGDGKDRAAYERLVSTLKIYDRVTMPGMVNDVDQYYSTSDLFCIPSLYEGFGLVTTEAQTHGLAVVGFSQCSGTNDIIIHGKNGILAQEMSAECLAENLRMLMNSPDMRLEMGRQGQEMLSRYDETIIYDCWEDILIESSTIINNTRLQNIKKQSPQSVASCDEEKEHITAIKQILSRKRIMKQPKADRIKKSIAKRIKKIFKIQIN